jgi:hypothetical protein
MNQETVVFLLGDKFRWSLMGDDDGDENDEDSVINDLDFHLANYEANWDGTGLATILEHWKWERLNKVVWVRRNSGKVRDAVDEEKAAKRVSAMVSLPIETDAASAYWVVMGVMRLA